MSEKKQYLGRNTDHFASIVGIIIFAGLLLGDFYLLFLLVKIYLDKGNTGSLVGSIILIVFAIIFALVIRRSYKRIKQVHEDFETLDPDYDFEKEPWMANEQWRNKLLQTDARYNFKNISMGVWILVLLVVALLFLPILVFAFYNISATASSFELALMYGICFLILAVCMYFFLIEGYFGRTVCHLKTLPAWVGETFEAEIEIEFPYFKTGQTPLPEKPFNAEIQLCRVVRSGNYTRVIVSWRSPVEIPIAELNCPGDGTMHFPVSIPISETYTKAKSSIGYRNFWRLQVSNWFGKLFYRCRFTVPVFDKSELV